MDLKSAPPAPATAQAEPGDSELIDALHVMLMAVPSLVVAFNDDPDIECEDSPDGMMPVGFRIASSGCQGAICSTGPTLRDAIKAAIGRGK